MADTKLVNLRVPIDLLERFDAGLKERERTRTAWVLDLMERQVAKWDEDTKR